MEWIKVICHACPKEFIIQPTDFRKRMKNAKGKRLFCSHKCSARTTAKERIAK